MNKALEAIIFDFDNTLIDVWPIMIKSIRETFKKFDKEDFLINNEHILMERSLRDYFPKIFLENHQEAEVFYRKKYLEYSTNINSFKGAEETLNRLRNNNIDLFIVSNKLGSILRKEVSDLGWNNYFTSIVGSGDAKEDKPSKEPVLQATKSTGVKLGDKVLFVGDTYTDIQCAKNSNCTPILFGIRPLSKILQDFPSISHCKDYHEFNLLISNYGLK